jgi:hypothetical protein
LCAAPALGPAAAATRARHRRPACSPTLPTRRAELGLGDDYYQTTAGQRERLLTSTDRLDRTGGRIQQGRQQLLETEVSRR